MNIKTVSILDAIALMIFAIDMGTYFFEINFFLRYLPFLLGLNFIVFLAARSKDFIYLSIALTIIFLCCMIWNQDTSLNISSILINLSLGLYLYLRLPNRKAISFLVVFFLMILTARVYISLDDLEQILVGGSVNYVSIISLSACGLYYTFNSKKNAPVNIFPALLTCTLCLLTTGRSGSATSIILLVGLFLYNYKFMKRKTLTNLSYIAILLTTILVIVEYSNLLYSLDNPSSVFFRFSQIYADEGRALILIEYFNNFGFFDFLFGKGNDTIFEATGLSIHISYLQWHISLGAFAILIYVLVLFANFKLFLTNKLYWLIMTVFILRAATDHVMLTAGFIFGPLLIYFCAVVYHPYYLKLKTKI